jgi:hypothetical protein
MPLLSQPAFGPRTAIVYITVGSLIDVWTAVWYFTFARDDHGNISRNTWFWLAGLFLTGLTLIIIGILLGEIGRSARKAEMPPAEAQDQEAAIQETAAAHPPAVAAGMMGGVPGMAPGMVGGVPMAGTAAMAGAAPGVVMPAPAAPPAGTQQQPSQFVPGVTRR